MFLISILFTTIIHAHSDFLPDTFSTEYEESYLSTTQKKEKKSFGKIDYKFPHQIRFEVLKPEPSIFTSNVEKSWYYTPPFIPGEEGQVVIQKSNDLVLAKLLDHLREGLVANKNYDVFFKGNEAHINFKQKFIQDLKINKVILKSTKDASKIKEFNGFYGLDLSYNSGQIVHLVFKNFKQGTTFPDGYFNFTVPPKTKISEQ